MRQQQLRPADACVSLAQYGILHVKNLANFVTRWWRC